jgi:hypothetical protein
MQSTTIWNSLTIKQSIDKLRMGLPTDLSPFHQGDIDLKADNILFQLTPEEIDEFHKCSEDIIYFVETYCRFMTDKGRKLVKLRDYQKKILLALAEEHYINALEEFGPKNRNIITLASRQIGKCLFNADILIQYPDKNIYKVPISIFYYMSKGTLSFIEKIKVKLLILYYKLEN